MFFDAGKTRGFSALSAIAKHEVDGPRRHANACGSAEKRRICNKKVKMSSQGIVLAHRDTASSLSRGCASAVLRLSQPYVQHRGVKQSRY